MRICQYVHDGKQAIGLVTDDRKSVVNLAGGWDAVKGDAPSELRDYVVPRDVLALVNDADRGRAVADYVNGKLDKLGAQATPIGDVDLRAPISRPGKFFAIAVNGDSRRRAIMPENAHPTYFIKLHSCIIGPYDTIEIPDIGQCGPEIELLLVIGKGGKAIPESEAMDHVYGYMVHNDITAHELRKTTEWVHIRRPDGTEERLTYPGRYKNFDTFSPMGPWLTTPDDVSDPQNLAMAAYLNEDKVQAGTTSNYFYSLPQLISHLSWAHTLEPGDIISCGTVSPVAPWKSSTIDLGGIGGTLHSEIEELGELHNPIRFVPGKQNFGGAAEVREKAAS